ncbi:MAG: YigZ family protein [Ignavibacteriae bacterium]|nr:YigZ family protein [Ignavibacteriota bacterium]
MLESKRIFVIEDITQNKLKEKGSSFLGYAVKVNSSEEAVEKLNEVKKEYYDATHHCYAYITLAGEEKYSDDGEPNGTAGIRIINAIKQFNLYDILVVVVRYYGGTKLGVGPLGKAYSTTVVELLDDATKFELEKYHKISIEYNFEDSSNIHYLINKHNAKNINPTFIKSPIIECFLKPFEIDNLNEKLTNITKGRSNLIISSKNHFLRKK